MTEDIKKACEILRAGGLILYPTDTIWGIGCDATNDEAVRKVYALKRRVDNKAMLVLLDNPIKLESYVEEIPEIAWDLIELADKPLTVIFSKAKNLSSELIAADGSVGLRITHEEFSRRLCERYRKPIVSTSANVSGTPSPGNYSEIAEEIRKGVDYIVSYRQEEKSKAKPSNIVKLEAGGIVKIIR